MAHSDTFDGLRYAALGEHGGALSWQLLLAAAAWALLCWWRTRGRPGLPASDEADDSSDDTSTATAPSPAGTGTDSPVLIGAVHAGGGL